MHINRFLSGEPVIFEGFLQKREKNHLSIQVHPGLTVDLEEKACKSVEEATDPVSGKTYVRITLGPDADVNATFQPRLARLALRQGAAGVPFSMGGLPEGVKEGPVFLARRAGGGGVGGGGYTYNTPTIGEFATRCNVIFWGYVDDDTEYSDRSTDSDGSA